MLTFKHSPLNINNSLSRPYLHPSLLCRRKSRALHNSLQSISVTNLNRFTVTASHSILALAAAENQGVRNITSQKPNVKIINNGIRGHCRRGPRRGRIDEKRQPLNIFKPYVFIINSNRYLFIIYSNRYLFIIHSNRYLFIIHSNYISFVFIITTP